MDFLNKLKDGAEDAMNKNQGQQQQGQQGGSEQKKDDGGFLGKLSNMGNEALGGGKAGEDKEDGLDKAYDMFQEKVLKKGPQDNETAAEQAQDEFVTDQIRDQYKKMTGKDFPIADK